MRNEQKRRLFGGGNGFGCFAGCAATVAVVISMLLSSIGLRLRRYGLRRERWDAVATLAERSPLSGSAAYGGRLGLNLCVCCLAHARTTSEMRDRACRNYGHWRVISVSPERGSTVGHLAAANLP